MARRSHLVRRIHGFTLIEMMIVVGIIAAFIVMASLRLDRWQDAESVKSAARTIEGAFSYARSEATRTGNNHLVFFRTDIAGNDLLDSNGDPVPILILDDGRPGSAEQDCEIDAGEPIQPVLLEGNMGWGPSAATAKVPIDEGPTPFAGGFTFQDTGGNAATWVLFRPDGTPRSADAACALGALGTGGGGVYLSNSERDVAVVLTPLGAARVFAWNGGSSQWN